MLIINFEGREAKGLSKDRYDETFAGEDATRHASEYDMRYSISISQPPPAVIITHYRMFLIEVRHRCI